MNGMVLRDGAKSVSRRWQEARYASRHRTETKGVPSDVDARSRRRVNRMPSTWKPIMAKESDAAPRGLEALQAAIGSASVRKLPPIHLWNPPFCGDIDMRIARDGTWFYGGTPIGRAPLVQLFASVLRREKDRFVLVTPVEKVGITVEDAPFLAVEMQASGLPGSQNIAFRTNVEDWVNVDADHPLRFEPGEADGLKPYVRVRGDLWALVKRALFYDLVDCGEVRDIGGKALFGVASAGTFFPMAPADTIGMPA